MDNLKRVLFECYGGFSDRRIKDLAKHDTFIADGRGARDLNARGEVYPSFCMVFVRVRGPVSVQVDLRGNVPVNDKIEEWILRVGGRFTPGTQPSLQLPVTPRDVKHLKELAKLIEAIVQPGAPRYAVKSYKYTCPQTANSLRRLGDILEAHWGPQQPAG